MCFTKKSRSTPYQFYFLVHNLCVSESTFLFRVPPRPPTPPPTREAVLDRFQLGRGPHALIGVAPLLLLLRISAVAALLAPVSSS